MFVIATYVYKNTKISANGDLTIQPQYNGIPAGFSPYAVSNYSASAAGVIVRALNAKTGQMTLTNTRSVEVEIFPSMQILCIKTGGNNE